MRRLDMKKWMFALCVLMLGTSMQAQDLKSILSGLGKAIEDKVGDKVNNVSLVGTWKYAGPDCKFKSDNFLATAGGEVAAKQVESKMSEVLSKLGLKEGCTYVFNADSTYTSTVNGHTTHGTYTYDASTKELQLRTRLGLKFNATVSQGLSSDKLNLLFNADKLMSLAKTLGNAAGSANSTLSTVNSLLKQYDGLQLGFALERE